MAKVLNLEQTLRNLDIWSVEQQAKYSALEKIEQSGSVESGGESIAVPPEKLAIIKANLVATRARVLKLAEAVGVKPVWKEDLI